MYNLRWNLFYGYNISNSAHVDVAGKNIALNSCVLTLFYLNCFTNIFAIRFFKINKWGMQLKVG